MTPYFNFIKLSDAITEYKHTDIGITEKSKVVGCSEPHLITDEVIKYNRL